MKANKSEIEKFLNHEFPQCLEKSRIELVEPKSATLRYLVDPNDLRPGGTVSGPTMMTLADFALYVAILGEIGLVGLTVTTSMSVNFLRKPEGNKDLIAKCVLIKVGKTLVVGEVWIYSEGHEDAVAHVVGTYSIPPQAK